ncbi:hypothetical protein IE988_05015 [Klebsiella pneumoniae]|uniref:4Fe-4S Mo/W bis-MGD-type domain-containing protein n=1 Tax=Klebsiella pneumoniae TaxID=573 RepID=A0A927DXV7_KLEPN|nr:hypothetical protein [Klebsiella pneumoniae]
MQNQPRWSITAKSFGLKRRRGKPTEGTLCLKGYYGWDFINDTQILTPRLKTPMIRRQRGGKLEAVSSGRGAGLRRHPPQRH